MASRAFFRCRACGEPVVAGAYRCPVCGIDFPTGTPGAPLAPHSPAAVDPAGERDRRGGLRSAEGLAARLDEALGEELAPAAAAPGAPAGTPSSAGSLAAVVPAGDATPAHPSAVSDAKVDVADESPAHRARGGDLTLAPARERVAAAPRVVPARPLARAGGHGRRPRSIVRGLTGTVVLAVALLLAVGGGAWWLDRADLADRAAPRPETAAAGQAGAQRLLSVDAADGWVDVPVVPGALFVTADGPFRVRLDDVVYTLDGGQAVRVPTQEATRVAVRAVGPSTVATVSRSR